MSCFITGTPSGISESPCGVNSRSFSECYTPTVSLSTMLALALISLVDILAAHASNSCGDKGNFSRTLQNGRLSEKVGVCEPWRFPWRPQPWPFNHHQWSGDCYNFCKYSKKISYNFWHNDLATGIQLSYSHSSIIRECHYGEACWSCSSFLLDNSTI